MRRILWVVVGFGVLVSGCTGTTAQITTTPVAATSSSTVASTTSTSPPPTAYGDDEELDQLYDSCSDGGFSSCDLLLARSVPGSLYEEFAVTCGERHEPLDNELCADAHAALGSVEVSEAETILVAAIQSRSFDFGLDQVRGVELAIADFGPLSNRDVELVVMDDSECDPVQGVAAAVAIASQAEVTGVLGPSCSRVATEVSPILSEAGLVLLSASASIPELTSDLRGNQGTNWSQGFYRTFYNDLRFAVAGAAFMFEELELSNVAVVHTPDDYAKGLAGGFAVEFEELGGTVHPIVIPGDASDLRSFLTDIERVGPDGIFLIGNRPMADLFVTQSAGREDLRGLPIVGGPPTAFEDFLQIPETEGMYFTQGVFEFPDVVSFNGTTIRSLESLYRQTYGERPATDFYAYAYDATMLLLTSIDKTAVEKNGLLLIDRDALRDALTTTTSFEGVTGSITCDQFGDCGPEKTVIVQNTKPTRPDAGMTNVVWEHPPASG